MAFGVRAPVPGTVSGVVPGAPMSMGPMTYPMPPTTAHRLCLRLQAYVMVQSTHLGVIVSAIGAKDQ
ncbi:hypothetical protein GH714_017124 [Hevea brasiliensis]|uniref:Uncharacterized protein n=1 Tax=Hevea brasiliensis TaxID=3981 RepID=A0A6A6N8D7_HEVBR|nr:hypothetical protein GH714_017124 [Hevea brasiliensis]